MENCYGLLVDFHLTQATGMAEREVVPELIEQARERGFHPRTLGADESCDTRACVADLRARKVTPDVMQNTSGRRSATDGRTTRQVGYATSQRIRRRVEIVCSQLTKRVCVLTLVVGMTYPNLHCVVSDDHSVNQQLYQFSALLEESLPEPTGSLLENLSCRAGDMFDATRC